MLRDGELVHEFPPLAERRERTLSTLRKLPAEVRAIEDQAEYPVAISDGLAATAEAVQADLRAQLGL